MSTTECIKNLIGVEVEYFLHDEKGELVFPLEHDSFPLIGELRPAPGASRGEVLGNFFKDWFNELSRQRISGTHYSFGKDNSGKMIIPIAKFKEAMLRAGRKELPKCQNVHGTEIFELSDDIIEKGKLVGKVISCGLHIHFTSCIMQEVTYEAFSYEPINIPINFPLLKKVGAEERMTLELYKRRYLEKDKKLIVAKANRITKPVIKYIVEEMDKLLPTYVDKKNESKFRKPGFYEMKDHGGFEYRSLPMSDKTFKDIDKIVDYAFTLLGDI